MTVGRLDGAIQRGPWALALLLFVASPAVGSAQATPGDSVAVVGTIEAVRRATAEGDTAAVERLLAPDAVILENASVETRSDYLAGHLGADMAFARAVPAERGPIHVRVLGDVAWATSTSTSRGEFRGRRVNSSGAELMVLTRSGDGWRISAVHWSSRQRP